MNPSRLNSINAVASLTTPKYLAANPASIDCYAEDVFSEKAINQFLPKSTAKKLLSTINGECQFDPDIAPAVAKAMKDWAISRGATHFTHWFQPLTSGTAEKHDSFLERVGRDKAILDFSAKNLIVGESDASSFPSGGLRCTFEARGYTAWDPTSPAFIKRHSNGATLCIPTIFCSYTGEALDKKTPLLRANQALEKAVSRLMKIFGLKKEHTSITLGIEQEYFLIDRHFYLQRPDLLQTGRTIFGAAPSRLQQMEDHYFGSIKPRILTFMGEVEQELWRLGIPAKTRHNEAAPAQFELAPLFEDINLAVDHNMLIMEVLRQCAARNGLICLLHEKPFAGVNGSGKHNNWSINYGKRNLLDPGETPHENAIFLTMLTAIMRAINLHSDLLRAVTSSAGNDHRLGANEAPPAIISIFLGDQLTEIISNLEHGNRTASSRKASKMRIGVDVLPALPRDATDRNRTSPFAFTGNKFEFRAPGSSQSCANVMTVLNTIVSESIDHISDQLEKSTGANFNAELQKILMKLIAENKRIIFNGDNYNEDWRKEAAKRGLPNLMPTPVALQPLLNPSNQQIFEKYGVLSEKEMISRYEVFKDDYERKIRMEANIAIEIVDTMILPAVAMDYRNRGGIDMALAGSALHSDLPSIITDANELANDYNYVADLSRALKNAISLSGNEDKLIAIMNEMRRKVDKLEKIVNDELWPLPKYREMLFIY